MATQRKEIGPFPGKVKPARTGLYLRISKKGNEVWSWFNTSTGKWGKYGSNKQRAVQRGRKPSKHQSLDWIGPRG
jgi:hypothetical protein